MKVLLLLAVLLCSALPNRWIAPALPLLWVLERLLPIGLSSVANFGPAALAPSDLLILLLLGKLVVSMVLRKELVIERSIALALGLYLVVNFIATIAAGLKFGEGSLAASLTSLARFSAEALVIVVVSQSVRTLAHAKRFLFVLLGTLTLLAAIQYINAVGSSHGVVIGEVQGLERGEARYFGPVGDSIGMVLLLGYLTALCFGSVIGALVFLGAILLTAGLGAILATAVGSAFFLFFGLRRPEIRAFAQRRLVFVPLLALGGLAALVVFPNSLGTTLLSRVTSGTYLQSGAQRQASSKLAAKMILDNPLLGVGYMGYERTLAKYGGDAHFDLQHPDGGTANANNQILQALTDSGIPGLLAFAGLVFCAARLFYRIAAWNSDRFLSAAYLAAFLWLLTQLFGNLAAVWLNPASFVTRLLWVLLGVAVAMTRLLPAAQPISASSHSPRPQPQLLPV